MADGTITIRGKAPGEADLAYPLDRVLAGLIAALQAGRIDDAVDVYVRCREDVAFQLIAKSQGNRDVFQQVANLFFRARDFARAAYCCEQLEEHAKAAALYERCDDFALAAQMYAAAGDRTKAADMFEKDGNTIEAARLFADLGEHLRAAACYERAQRPFDAATSWQKAGRLDRAIEVLSTIDEDSPERKVANKVIRELTAQLPRGTASRPDLPAVNVAVEGPSPGIAVLGTGAAIPLGSSRAIPMEGFDALRDLPLFADLSLGELKALHGVSRVVAVTPGQVLIRAGSTAPALFVVLEGQLSVRSSGQVVQTLTAGQHAGEMSLVDDAPAAVDVVVDLQGRMLCLERDGFRAVLADDERLALRVYKVFLRVLSERLRDTTARLGRSA